jgi:cobalt-zinc-cadmium efflux system outer membrane protein
VQAQDALIILRRAENEVQAAWRRLSSVLGTRELEPQPLAGDLEDALVELEWNDELSRLLAQSPEIAAAIADRERARWALQRACAEVKPNLDLMATVQQDNTTDDEIAGVQVGLPVPILNRNQGGIRQARAEVAAANRNIDRVRLDLQHRLATVFQQYADARFQVERYSQEIVPKAQRTLELVTTGYRLGELGYLDMLTAQRTYFQTNLAYIEALRELWRARLHMDGLLLDNSLKAESGGLRDES